MPALETLVTQGGQPGPSAALEALTCVDRAGDVYTDRSWRMRAVAKKEAIHAIPAAFANMARSLVVVLTQPTANPRASLARDNAVVAAICRMAMWRFGKREALESVNLEHAP